MIERDYIMRMIHQLSIVLAEILLGKKLKQFERSLDLLRSATETLVGLKFELFEGLPDTELVKLLSVDQTLGTPKIYAVAVLAREYGEILEAQGEKARSVAASTKSLSLFLEAFLEAGAAYEPAHTKSIDRLITTLDNIDLPIHVENKILLYYRMTNRLDQAEDVLFDLIARDKSYAAGGIVFYEQLLKSPDETLKSGNLPRSEVEETLNELRRLVR